MYMLFDEPPCECMECLEKDNKMQDVRYWFRAVLDQLYGLEEFDLEFLQHSLEQLGACVEIKFPEKPLIVQEKKPETISEMLDAWKVYNKNYLKSLAPTGV